MSEVGHNSADPRLHSLVQRIERLEDEKSMLALDIKEIFTEAKSQGYDVKVIRKVLRLRKMDADSRREQQELVETYCAALGMLD